MIANSKRDDLFSNSVEINVDASIEKHGPGKAIVKANGDFWDLSVGVYPLVARPHGATSWQLKFGVSYFFD